MPGSSRCYAEGYQVFASGSIVAEVETAIAGNRIKRPGKFDGAYAGEVLKLLGRWTVETTLWPEPSVAIRDPRDRHIVALAMFARADLIVSQDKDLLTLGVAESIAVVNIHDFAYTLGIRH